MTKYREILRLTALGLSLRDIEKSLKVSRKTVVKVQKRAELSPSQNKKNVTPHTFRHSAAMNLLQAGVDISTIAIWLGCDIFLVQRWGQFCSFFCDRGYPLSDA